MEFLDHLNALFRISSSYVYWADIYKQLEDAAINGEKYTTFTENFGAVMDLADAAKLKYEKGKHEVQFIKVWGWA